MVNNESSLCRYSRGSVLNPRVEAMVERVSRVVKSKLDGVVDLRLVPKRKEGISKSNPMSRSLLTLEELPYLPSQSQ